MPLATADNFATALWLMDGAANSHEPDEIDANNLLLDIAGNLGTGATVFGRTDTRALVTSGSSYFAANAHADLALGDIDFSVRMLVRFNAVGSTQSLLSVRNSAAPSNRAVVFYMWTDSILYCQVSSAAAGGNPHEAASAGALSANTDYHVVVTYNATTDLITIYVNGSAGSPVAHTGGAYSDSPEWRIGRDPVISYSADCSISEVIYLKGYCLSAAEVTTDYNSPGVPLAFSAWASDTGGSSAVVPAAVHHLRQQGIC